MTKERYKTGYSEAGEYIFDSLYAPNKQMGLKEACTLLNEQNEVIHTLVNTELRWEQKAKEKVNRLEEENNKLEENYFDIRSELEIVENELKLAIENGFAPSQPYINYMASKKTDYEKFWEMKINMLKGD